MKIIKEVREARKCARILLESHRELLSGNEIEALENAERAFSDLSDSIDSETRKSSMKSLAVDVLALVAKVGIKVFTEE